MTLDWKIEKPGERVAVAALAAGIILLLAFIAVSNLVVGVITDTRVTPPRETLEAAASYFPNSARLNAQLARSEMTSGGRDLAAAESFARQATELSPNDYAYRLLLATVEEAKGDREAASESFRRAIALAPNNADLRWRHANLMLRRGFVAQSVNEFRFAATSNRRFIAPTLDLIWRASGGSLDAVRAVIPDDANARFTLARFFLSQSLIQEAASVLRTIDRGEREKSAETPKFLDAMIAAGEFQIARDLWLDVVGGGAGRDNSTILWNGGFESEAIKQVRAIRLEHKLKQLRAACY